MKLKKIISLCSSITIGGLLATTLSSCVGVNEEVTDNLVSRGDGTKFSSHTTFQDQVKNALKSNTGSQAFKKSLADDLVYSWYKDNIEKLEKKDKWAELEKEIKKAYDDKVDSYKNDHKQNWEYYFQNEVLDPVGGTEELYKKSEMVAKARTAFSTNVFNFTNYLTLGDGNGIIGQVEAITKDKLLDTGNWGNKIDFYGQAPGSKYSDTFTLPMQFARIQKLAWEEYAKKNNPISISMALWKYGDPKGGIESIYNKDVLKDVEIKSSYNFPAFSSTEPGASGEKGTQQLFDDFIKKFKSGSDGIEEQDSGLMNIPKSVTEDSETQIVVNLKHLFDNSASGGSGLETIFAGSVGELVGANANITGIAGGSGTNIPKYDLSKYVVGTNDLLDIFFNSETGSTLEANAFDFANVYPDKPIRSATNPYFDIFNEKSKYYKNSVITSGKTAIKIEKETKTPFILTRDEFGVHFIGIDGWKYLTSSTGGWTQSKQNDILKVKSLLYKEYQSNYSKVDIDSSIKSYFDTNTDDLILNIAIEDTKDPVPSQKDTIVFNHAKEILGDNVQNLQNYIQNHTKAKELKEKVKNTINANKKIMEWSKNLSQNFMITNYGSDKTGAKTNAQQLKNGLATPLSFKWNQTSSASNDLVIKSSDYYNAAQLQSLSDDGKSYEVVTETSISNALNSENNAIGQILKESNLKPNIIKTGMAQWSESILGSGEGKYVKAINAAIISFSKDGNSLANAEKAYAFDQYITDSKIDVKKDYKNELNGLYYSKKYFNNESKLSSHYVKNNNQPKNIPEYKNVIDNLKNIDEKINAVVGSNISDDYLNSQILNASIAYLAKDNFKNLIEYLRSVISWDNPAAVVWLREDISDLNNDFTTLSITDSAEKIYGWSSNYLGENSLYNASDVKLADNTKTSSFTSFDQYWSTAKMPTGAGTGIDVMGYCGLQTASSSTLPSVVNEAIFTKPADYYGDDKKPLYGVLARYGSVEELCKRVTGADAKSIRDLAGKIKTLCGKVSEVETWANTVMRETYQAGDADLDGNVGQKVTLKDVEERFKTIGADTSADKWKFNLKEKLKVEQVFNKINGIGDGTSGKFLFEPKTSGGQSSVLPEKDKSYLGFRTTYLQINNNDLYSNDGDNWEEIKNNLFKVLGGEENRLLENIVVQFAQDASIQARVVSDIVKTVYKGDKVEVFTRAMNDELGQAWVKDWKKKP